MSILHKLQWRYATDKFDNSKVVSEEQITELLEAMNLAPSAFGLQPYDFIVIKDKDLQAKLVEHSYGQSKIADASHLVVITARREISLEYIQEYVRRIEVLRSLPVHSLKDFEDMMIGTFSQIPIEQHLPWSQRQAYIVLGTLLVAAADAKIDACPMEGFIPEKYNEILGLNERGMHASVIIPLGYRSVDDKKQNYIKSRRSLTDIVQLRYK